ncbi:MAG: N-acetylglucosamine-6-phosphate deacetylase [Planctomycetota bacterium]
MPELALAGRIVTPEGALVPGTLVLAGDRIQAVREGPGPAHLLLPGMIDLHVHGGDGADVMDGPAGLERLARFHLRQGTTSLCPTTITAPLAELARTVEAVGAQPSDPQGARLLGVHLEGPFIAPARRGAQPDFCRSPSWDELRALLDRGPVDVVTLAPELPGALELIGHLSARGVRVSLGHSAATYAQARAGFAAGARGVTHLFNAMSGLHHRHPGLAAAALAEPEVISELILDLEHVHPDMVRHALMSARGKLALVSDAIRATGGPEGESELGGQRVCVKDGRATLANGTLAGSILTLDQALRNAVGLGLDPQAASALLSLHPAQALRRDDLGRLTPGALGDVLVVDPDTLELQRVFKGGREVDLG